MVLFFHCSALEGNVLLSLAVMLSFDVLFLICLKSCSLRLAFKGQTQWVDDLQMKSKITRAMLHVTKKSHKNNVAC